MSKTIEAIDGRVALFAGGRRDGEPLIGLQVEAATGELARARLTADMAAELALELLERATGSAAPGDVRESLRAALGRRA